MRHEVALANVHYETTIATEPTVPSVVVYRHRRSWQRPGRKLPKQCTFACHGRENDREEVFWTTSVNAVQGLGWMTRLTQVNWVQASLIDKEPKALRGFGQKAMSSADPFLNWVTRIIETTGVMPETNSSIVVRGEHGKPVGSPHGRQVLPQGEPMSRWADEVGKSQCRPVTGRIGARWLRCESRPTSNWSHVTKQQAEPTKGGNRK